MHGDQGRQSRFNIGGAQFLEIQLLGGPIRIMSPPMTNIGGALITSL
jgi:hypothetical protein